MAGNLDELRDQLNTNRRNSSSDSNSSGGLDKEAIFEISSKIFSLVGILAIGCVLYIMLEKAVTAKTLVPIRATTFSIFWAVLCWRQSKFLNFGLWQILATLTVITNLANFFREFMLNTVK